MPLTLHHCACRITGDPRGVPRGTSAAPTGAAAGNERQTQPAGDSAHAEASGGPRVESPIQAVGINSCARTARWGSRSGGRAMRRLSREGAALHRPWRPLARYRSQVCTPGCLSCDAAPARQMSRAAWPSWRAPTRGVCWEGRPPIGPCGGPSQGAFFERGTDGVDEIWPSPIGARHAIICADLPQCRSPDR